MKLIIPHSVLRVALTAVVTLAFLPMPLLAQAISSREIFFTSNPHEHIDTVIAPDGRQLILALAASHSAWRDVHLISRNRFGAIKNQWIGEVQVNSIDGPTTPSLRLVSNGREVWALWDSDTDLFASARRVYPTLGRYFRVNKTYALGEGGFALALDQNSHLYLAVVANSEITIHRHEIDGDKQTMIRKRIVVDTLDQSPERSKVSLILDGEEIHLAAALSFSAGSTPVSYETSVRLYRGTNHPDPSQVSFQPWSTIAANAATDPTHVIGAEIELAVGEPGIPPAVFAYDSLNEVHWLGYFDFSTGTWQRQNLPQSGVGGSVGITSAGGGRFHLLWSSRDSASNRYAVWRANSVNPGSPISPILLRDGAISPNPPDLAIASDHLGNPVYAYPIRDSKGSQDYRLVSDWPLDLTDENFNGFVFLQEAAGLSFAGGPELGFRVVGSETYPTLTMTTLTGGVGFPNGLYRTANFVYQVESTIDLDTWTPLPVIFVNAFEFNGRRTATYRTNLPLSTHPRQMMRVGVRRAGP